MRDHTEMNQEEQNKEFLKSLEDLSEEEEQWLFRPFDDDESTESERTALNKYEKLFLKALVRNSNVSWVDSAVMALAADLEEYTGETVYVGGPFASEVFLSCGNNHSIITAELTRSKMFQNYRSQDSSQDERIPMTLGEIAAVLAPGSSGKDKYPYTRADLEALICGVVDYEAEEPDGLGWQNLQAMGFNDEDMIFFGMPPYLEDEEEGRK